MIELNNIQNLPLKTVLIIHFVLISWGIQGYWSPDSYFFYNSFFILCLLWAIHQKESSEPLQIAVAINGLSVLFDVIVLAVYFPNNFLSSERFSVAMTILNLVVRPVTCVVLCRLSAERAGDMPGNNTFGDIFGRGPVDSTSRLRNTYDDIDNPQVHQSVPGTVEGSGNKQPPAYHG